eukprot:6213652-Pleurochrysis_carterae.AAC.3
MAEGGKARFRVALAACQQVLFTATDAILANRILPPRNQFSGTQVTLAKYTALSKTEHLARLRKPTRPGK